MPSRSQVGALAVSCSVELTVNRLSQSARLGRPSLGCGPLGPCCIRALFPGWEGGKLAISSISRMMHLDFVASHTSCVPEDPASLLINRLAGRWAIKTSLRIELELRRPAGVVPHSSSMNEEFFEIPGKPEFLCESRL